MAALKLDAKTLVAVATVITALTGGVEMRVAISRLEDKIDRVEERVGRVEREVSPGHLAVNESSDP